MCDYCSNGSLPLGKIPCVNFDLDLGCLGISNMSIYIRRKDGRAFYDLAVNPYGVGTKTVRNIQEIEYCCFCGKKIGEIKDE